MHGSVMPQIYIKHKARTLGMRAEILLVEAYSHPKKGFVMVRFVSDKFKEMNMIERHKSMEDMIDEVMEKALNHYNIVHEECTEKEAD